MRSSLSARAQGAGAGRGGDVIRLVEALSGLAAGLVVGAGLAGAGLAAVSWSLVLAGVGVLLGCEVVSRRVLPLVAGRRGPWRAVAGLVRGWGVAGAVVAVVCAVVTLPGPVRGWLVVTVADATVLLPGGLRERVGAVVLPGPPSGGAVVLVAALLVVVGVVGRLVRLAVTGGPARSRRGGWGLW